MRHGTWVKNRIHSLLHERLIQTPFDPFTLRGRQWLQELQLSTRDRAEIDTLLRILDAVANEQAKITELVNADAYGRDGVKLASLSETRRFVLRGSPIELSPLALSANSHGDAFLEKDAWAIQATVPS